MDGYKNLPCSKCGRNTKHKRVKQSNLTSKEFVLNKLSDKERWKCLICKTVETFSRARERIMERQPQLPLQPQKVVR